MYPVPPARQAAAPYAGIVWVVATSRQCWDLQRDGERGARWICQTGHDPAGGPSAFSRFLGIAVNRSRIAHQGKPSRLLRMRGISHLGLTPEARAPALCLCCASDSGATSVSWWWRRYVKIRIVGCAPPRADARGSHNGKREGRPAGRRRRKIVEKHGRIPGFPFAGLSQYNLEGQASGPRSKTSPGRR